MKRAQTSSRSVSTKKLTISEYRRRLKDNVRSLSENLSRMVQAAKVGLFLSNRCICIILDLNG